MSALTNESGSRRDFLGHVATAGVVLAAGACATAGAHAADAAPLPATKPYGGPGTDPEKDNSWDWTWLTKITGKHKQVYDIGEINNLFGLRVGANYLNAWRDVYKLNPPEVTVVAGMISHGYTNFNDAIWAKYGLGEETKTKDALGAWVTRNVYRNGDGGMPWADYSIEAMQARGVIFWQCNNALKGITAHLATKMHMEPSVVRAELIVGLLPGVTLVPAHTMAIGISAGAWLHLRVDRRVVVALPDTGPPHRCPAARSNRDERLTASGTPAPRRSMSRAPARP